ncbi:hypothetical protein Ae505Ps2_0731c [Pseudonocardia sp. Ae505_Ps2]|nr:hypothetical protein Ae331Ps2_1389c [Pseudonocardia sp. Ae331_Ps2]OLM10608.1 hypothetical protein Ae505Ps2_0731c [Pseudonocardia sp. Ae505_Ps2]
MEHHLPVPGRDRSQNAHPQASFAHNFNLRMRLSARAEDKLSRIRVEYCSIGARSEDASMDVPETETAIGKT